jgi:drug/metabolite transporter (DMT)-like permease
VPVLYVVASVLLQAGVYGFVSGTLDSSDSLTLSCAGFASAAVVFNVVLLVRRLRGAAGVAARGAAVPVRVGRAPGLLLALNAATAVTFLSFYACLTWVPATAATGVETAVGPVVLALLGLAGRAPRATGRGWCAAGLLVFLGVAVAHRLTADAAFGPGLAAGLALVVVAGCGAPVIALISTELGRRGVDPVYVTAHRFHLTYLLGGVLLLPVGGPGGDWAGRLPETLLTGVLAVTLPLYWLQSGLQRTDPMVAMVLLTTLPGATYLAECAFHGSFDTVALALICALIAVALGYVRASARAESAPVVARPPRATRT